MPFQSQAQAGWAFATGQPWAKRWARETGPYKKLPKRVKRKTCMDCVLASLKAEQIAPGVTRIRGNLCNVHGRYGPCDGGSAARKPKGKKGRAARKPAKPKQTPEQRAQARQAEQATNRAAVDKQLGLPEDTVGALDDLRAGKAVDDDGGLVKMGLAEQAADGSYRLTPAGRALVAARSAGDAGRARDIMSGAKDRAAARQQRQSAAQARGMSAAMRRAAKPAKPAKEAKPKGGGGGKGKKGGESGGVDTRAQREQERQEDRKRRQEEHAQDRAQRQREHAEDRAQRARERAEDRAAEQEARRQQQERTPAPVPRRRSPIVMPRANRGIRRTKAETYGGVKRSNLDDSVFAGPDRSFPIKTAQDVKDAVHSLGRTKHDKAAVKRGIIRRARAIGATDALPESWRTEKSFAVFKDTRGQWRWLARTTTAYEDRDSEVISTKALNDSAASAAPRGPLRWWHMGRPDPTSAQPWGAGVDLGWCDFAAMSGKTLIESGTFKSEAIARSVASHQKDLELSPGFFHAAGEPDTSGVFHHIRIFERSLVPKWAGRASNPYTGLIVEKTMDQKKIQALKELGASDEVITALLADVQQTEKSAEADGVRYKDARPVIDWFSRLLQGERITTKEAEPEEAAPAPVEEPAPPADPIALLTAELKALRDEVAALKAAPIVEEKQGEMDDMMPDAETPEEDVAEGGMEEPADEGGLTLSSEDLSAIGQVIAATLEPLIGALGITQKLDGHLSELKTMMSGYTKTKDDAQAALVSKVDQVEAKVAELSGDLPRAGYRASQAPDNTVQALAAAVALKDGSMPTDDNPFADLVQQLFPNQR